MTLTVELAEQEIAALKAKAATEGLSLEGWLRKIANLVLIIALWILPAAFVWLIATRLERKFAEGPLGNCYKSSPIVP
jgi:hypothetical protein